MAKTCESVKIWPPYPSLVYSKTEAKIHVFCINCKSLSERGWQGKIMGKGLHGSLNAFFTRIKHRYKLGHTPLTRLLTICIDCYTELELYYEANQIDQIFCFSDNKEIFRES